MERPENQSALRFERTEISADPEHVEKARVGAGLYSNNPSGSAPQFRPGPHSDSNLLVTGRKWVVHVGYPGGETIWWAASQQSPRSEWERKWDWIRKQLQAAQQV
jgi:hypothetical protein